MYYCATGPYPFFFAYRHFPDIIQLKGGKGGVHMVMEYDDRLNPLKPEMEQDLTEFLEGRPFGLARNGRFSIEPGPSLNTPLHIEFEYESKGKTWSLRLIFFDKSRGGMQRLTGGEFEIWAVPESGEGGPVRSHLRSDGTLLLSDLRKGTRYRFVSGEGVLAELKAPVPALSGQAVRDLPDQGDCVQHQGPD